MIPTQDVAPHNADIEAALLGELLLDPQRFFEVQHRLKPEDFFIVRHQWIYEAICTIMGRGATLDYLLLVNELENQGRLVDVGGAAYVLGLVNQAPITTHNVEGHADVVTQMATRRRLLEASQQIARVAHADGLPIDETIERAEAALFGATQQRQTAELYTMDILAERDYERMREMLASGQHMLGIRTYIEDYDRLTWSLPKGELHAFAGRPRHFKTAMILNIAVNNARLGIPIGIVSAEMTADAIAQRIAGLVADLHVKRHMHATLQAEEMARYHAKLQTISDLPLVVYDEPGMTLRSVETAIRRMVWQHHVQAVCVDYVQLIMVGAAAGVQLRERREKAQLLDAIRRMKAEQNERE